MTVRDLLGMEIDIDVYDDVCEDLGVAFCGPMMLTAEGEQEFGDALDLPVTLRGDYALVLIDGRKDWQHKLRRVKDLFDSLAGYCPEENYQRWFLCPDSLNY